MGLKKRINVNKLGGFEIDAYFRIDRILGTVNAPILKIAVYYNKATRDADINNYIDILEVPVTPVNPAKSLGESLYLGIKNLADWSSVENVIEQ